MKRLLCLGLLLGACNTVDVGPPLSDVNACRPSRKFFVEQIWPNFLDKDYGGKRCSQGSCHDAGSGRSLKLPMPTSAVTYPLPSDWEAIYKSTTEQLLCTNADASPLLTRPDGRTTHGGGQLIQRDGAEATLVKMWVSAP
jgi:hypothetical protein